MSGGGHNFKLVRRRLVNRSLFWDDGGETVELLNRTPQGNRGLSDSKRPFLQGGGTFGLFSNPKPSFPDFRDSDAQFFVVTS